MALLIKGHFGLCPAWTNWPSDPLHSGCAEWSEWFWYPLFTVSQYPCPFPKPVNSVCSSCLQVVLGGNEG